MPHTGYRTHLGVLIAVPLLALASAAGTAHAALSSSQKLCVNTFNKEFRKVVKAVGADYYKCVSDRAKSKDGGDKLGGLTVPQCFDADRKGKQAKATTKAAEKFTAACSGDDHPGVAVTDPATSNDAATTKEKTVFGIVFGDDPDGAVIRKVDDKAAAKCQLAVTKALVKCQDAKLNEFIKCLKTRVGFGVTAAEPLVACIEETWIGDEKGKVAKKCDLDDGESVDKIRRDIAQKCVATQVDLSNAFPACDTDDSTLTHRCLERRLECATCEAVLAADGFGGTAFECDLIDNGVPDASCGPLLPIGRETVLIPSQAKPAQTPGSPGVVVSNANLITRFGSSAIDLNKAIYTRFFLDPQPPAQPDAILVIVNGFEAGANGVQALAENVIRRASNDKGLVVEVWAFDRRSNQLEDLAGMDIAEAAEDPQIALDWLFGAELGLTLHPALAAGPNRRAVIFNTTDDVPFIGNWTTLTHSQDIDAVVEAALGAAANQNVFLGGVSAGTGFAARYAATDFDLSGSGPPAPGYAKLRGLIMLEGPAGNTAGPAPTADVLDRVEDRFDGGLFAAVRDGAPRCVDGTPCTVATETTDCAGKGKGTCTEPVTSYSVTPGLLNPRLLAAGEVLGIQAIRDPDSGPAVLIVDQGGIPGNNAVAKVPDLGLISGFVSPGTAQAILAGFMDDDGPIFPFAPFIGTGFGAPGPMVFDPVTGGMIRTWLDIREFVPQSALPHNGPPPTAPPFGMWGQEVEPTRIDRFMRGHEGEVNAFDWYYPSSGLGVTAGLRSLDSTPLSVGRGRRDIENLTQAGSIDIPVISFGGSNGLVPVPGGMVAFGQSLGTCAAPSCDGSTPRVVDALSPSQAFPTLGGVAGGFEVHISEGYSHVDIVSAEDRADNNIVAPLVEFVVRNLQ